MEWVTRYSLSLFSSFLFFSSDHIKRLEYFAAPFLFVAGMALFIWAWYSVGSVGEILEASENLVEHPRPFWEIFVSGLTGMLFFFFSFAISC